MLLHNAMKINICQYFLAVLHVVSANHQCHQNKVADDMVKSSKGLYWPSSGLIIWQLQRQLQGYTLQIPFLVNNVTKYSETVVAYFRLFQR